jgi:hypothetical protein
MRRGLLLATEAMQAGFAVFAPWTDVQLHLMCDRKLTIEECYACSMPWLEAADAVLLVEENSETSRGTQAELKRAKELGIPVKTSVEGLMNLRNAISVTCYTDNGIEGWRKDRSRVKRPSLWRRFTGWLFGERQDNGPPNPRPRPTSRLVGRKQWMKWLR